jgi:hypothetical protein
LFLAVLAMFAVALFVLWFCFVSCLLRRAPGSRLVPGVVPPGGFPLPPSVVAGCCLLRSTSGRSLSGGALSSRVARLRRLSVLV